MKFLLSDEFEKNADQLVKAVFGEKAEYVSVRIVEGSEKAELIILTNGMKKYHVLVHDFYIRTPQSTLCRSEQCTSESTIANAEYLSFMVELFGEAYAEAYEEWIFAEEVKMIDQLREAECKEEVNLAKALCEVEHMTNTAYFASEDEKEQYQNALTWRAREERQISIENSFDAIINKILHLREERLTNLELIKRAV